MMENSHCPMCGIRLDQAVVVTTDGGRFCWDCTAGGKVAIPFFVPCVIEYDGPDVRTEMILKDASIAWCPAEVFGSLNMLPGVELGYDMVTNELVGIRLYGRHKIRPRFHKEGPAT